MKKIFKNNKCLTISFITTILIGLICSIIKINNLSFVFFSLSANIFVITLIRMIMKILKIKWSKTEKIILIVSILVLYIFYFISILGRKFIYYWDFSCYYNLQIEAEKLFNTSLFQGIRGFISSTWSGEYGTFLSFFSEFIFNFSNKTINAYLISSVLVYIPYIIITFGILVKKLIKVLKIKKEQLFFISAVAIFSLFPMLHSTFIYGQPDLFGLTFIYLIIALTIDYDFYNLDYERLFEVGIITFMLLITRRWYMYFIITYYFLYGITIIILNIKDKKRLKTILKHALCYILIVGLFFGLTLFPLFKKIIVENYSYGYYLVNGFKGELISQINHLGYILLLIIIIGIVYGLINKKYRKYSIILIIQYFFIIFLFTRIQNMGLHHSLLLTHIYIYFICIFLLLIINKKILVSLLIIFQILNFGFCIYTTNNKIFSNVPLQTPKQQDYNELIKVGKWLKNKLKNDNAYMITHNNMYNPDKLRNLYSPDNTIKDHLPYGSAIEGVHLFPIQLFEAKYIITTDPFENVSIENKYNKVFLELVDENKFKKVKEFDMKNGYKIIIYERIESCTKEEAQKYLNELEDLSKEYPKLYKDVIEKYIKENL